MPNFLHDEMKQANGFVINTFSDMKVFLAFWIERPWEPCQFWAWTNVQFCFVLETRKRSVPAYNLPLLHKSLEGMSSYSENSMSSFNNENSYKGRSNFGRIEMSFQ